MYQRRVRSRADIKSGFYAAAPPPLSDLRKHVVERQGHGGHDGADDDAEDRDHQRFDQLYQARHGGVDLFLVEIGDLGQHLVEGAGLLADVDHLYHHRREDLGLGQRLAHGLALFDALPHRHDGVLDDGVAGGLGGDFEAVEDRHARGGQGGEGAAEACHRDLAQQHADHRDLEQRAIDDPAAAVGLVPPGHAEAGGDDDGDDEDEVAADDVAGPHYDAGDQRQLAAQAGEQLGEDRDHLPQDDEDHEGGDDDDRHRVDQRRFHLALQLDRLLDVGRQALQDDVQDAARLARRDHVDVEVVEGLRMFPHRLGERRAGLDVGAHGMDHRLEGAVLLLIAEDLQALHQRQAGVEHDRELAGEDGDALLADAARDPGQQLDLAPLLADRRDLDLLAPQHGDRRRLGVGQQLALLRLTGPRATFPNETGHREAPPDVSPADVLRLMFSGRRSAFPAAS